MGISLSEAVIAISFQLFIVYISLTYFSTMHLDPVHLIYILWFIFYGSWTVENLPEVLSRLYFHECISLKQ